MLGARNSINVNPSKLDQIRAGATKKTDLGTNVNKGVIQGKGGKYVVVEKEKKFEEAGVKRKKRNYVLYESKLGTEKEKNLQKIEEAPKPKPKPKPVARPRVEEKIIQKKKRIEYLDNYQYHETKNIKNPKRKSIVTHQRLGDIVGGVYEEHTYQRMSVNEMGKYSQQTTKTTSRRGPTGQMSQMSQRTSTTTSRTVPAQPREYRQEKRTVNTNIRNAPTGRATKTTTTVTRTGNRSSSRPAQSRTTTTTTTTKTVTRNQSAGGSRRRH